MVIRMFPPFPLPGFVPDFTAFELGENVTWYEVQKSMAQPPTEAVGMVSNLEWMLIALLVNENWMGGERKRREQVKG